MKQDKQSGFTIIEVMIVMGIVGTIITVVFLAVPALQRNARDSQRKDNVNKIANLMREYRSNNNGKYPRGNVGTSGASSDPSDFKEFVNSMVVPAKITSDPADIFIANYADNAPCSVYFQGQPASDKYAIAYPKNNASTPRSFIVAVRLESNSTYCAGINIAQN